MLFSLNIEQDPGIFHVSSSNLVYYLGIIPTTMVCMMMMMMGKQILKSHKNCPQAWTSDRAAQGSPGGNFSGLYSG